MPCCSPPPAATRPPSRPSSPATARGSSATRPRAAGATSALAEDAVQDGLVRAHRAIVGGKVPVDVEAWLYAIVRNRCHDYFRAAKPTSPLPPELPGGAPSAFEVVEQGERLAGALDAVERLPSAQRTALVGSRARGPQLRGARAPPGDDGRRRSSRCCTARAPRWPTRPRCPPSSRRSSRAWRACARARSRWAWSPSTRPAPRRSRPSRWRARARSARCTRPGRPRRRRPPSRRPRSSAAAHQPRPTPVVRAKHPTGAAARRTLEYSHCDRGRGRGRACGDAPRRGLARADAGAGEHGRSARALRGRASRGRPVAARETLATLASCRVRRAAAARGTSSAPTAATLPR